MTGIHCITFSSSHLSLSLFPHMHSIQHHITLFILSQFTMFTLITLALYYHFNSTQDCGLNLQCSQLGALCTLFRFAYTYLYSIFLFWGHL